MTKHVRELKHKDSSTPDGKWTVRITDDWVPLPEAALEQLGWTEGTELELVPIYGNQIVVRRKGALSNGAEVPSENT